MPLDLILAAAILTAPPDPVIQEVESVYGFEINRSGVPLSAFRVVAEALELMDPTERNYLFDEERFLEYSISKINERYAELRDAPPLCDAVRFPESKECRAMLRMNLEYSSWLQSRRTMFPAEEWIAEALSECESLWRIWNEAEGVRYGDLGISYRRKHMKLLRDLIGPHAYYSGCMPPPIPVWRLTRIH